MEKYITCKWKAKESEVAILISDKMDLKIDTITRDKEGHHIMIKASIQEEDTLLGAISMHPTQEHLNT